jgi:hypothetical protein
MCFRPPDFYYFIYFQRILFVGLRKFCVQELDCEGEILLYKEERLRKWSGRRGSSSATLGII